MLAASTIAPPSASLASPERSTPNSSVTPTMPTTVPPIAQPCSALARSKNGLRIATKIAVVATRIPASDVGIQRSA